MSEEKLDRDDVLSAREAKAAELQRTFTFEGFWIIRKELFANSRDAALTIRKDSFTFNAACIAGLEDVVYVQIMYNDQLGRIAVRPCDEHNKYALRWCIQRKDKRVSRKMLCRDLPPVIYKDMGWDEHCRYKMLGFRLKINGEYIYVFDLLFPQIFEEPVKSKGKGTTPSKPRSKKGYYSEDLEQNYGVSISEYVRENEVNEADGYISVEAITGKSSVVSSKKES